MTGKPEAKDLGHQRKCSPKKTKNKNDLQKNFSGELQKKKKRKVFTKIFQALHELLTTQKIMLSSSRGQGNFRGLEVVVFFYCRAKTNTQIANSANIRRHDLAQREKAKDQNKNVA